MGEGVYFSPMFVEVLPFTEIQKVEGKAYRLVFQCRIDPKEIRIPQGNETCWVIRKPSAIRPYGIVLIEETMAQKYPNALEQFKEKFTYVNFKAQIEGNPSNDSV